MLDPLRDLRAALSPQASVSAPPPDGQVVHPDFGREARTGVPEVIMAAGKEVSTLVGIVRTGLEQTGRVIVSRLRPSGLRAIGAEFADCQVAEYPRAHMAVVTRPGYQPQAGGGTVGIITAGTSDAPCAEQARVMAEAMGCTVEMVYDVGVAGLHRLMGPLERMLAAGVDVIVVVAGMDGALPSVVAGLVDVPVIGLPTSTGYGFGGRGVGALASMLQTCVPGLTVVNIDNGIGAGASAARMANRMARRARSRPGSTAVGTEPA